MEWIYHVSNKKGSMTQAEIDNNAYMIRDQLLSYGWTIEAICGMLGNARAESYLNPGQTQIGYKIGGSSGGFGLVMWTPQTNYTDWSKQNNHDVNSGYWQTWCISTEANTGGAGSQYIATSAYPLTYDEFKHSTDDYLYLVEVFLRNYERAGIEALSARKEYATYFWNLFGGQPTPPTPPTPPDPPDPDPSPYKRAGRMPVWMKIRYNI